MRGAGDDLEARRLRLRVVAAGATLAAAGLVLPGEGNLSARLGDSFLVTATGADLARLRPADLLEVPITGETPLGASTETAMHRAVYAQRPGVGAVVHAHPPCVLALSAAGGRPDVSLDGAGRRRLGGVASVGFLPPGSEALARAVADALATAPAVVLYGHGAVAVGASLAEALDRMLVLERLARAGLAAGERR